ncbi:permease [Marinicrinis sediminis]|uniref:Permease n=1 Tax=Marinicrinis sediminis TaxID=1652465 RepID=A0ABW5R926_9BACL
MGELKRYRFFLLLLLVLLTLTLVNPSLGREAFWLTGQSITDMLFLLPPIFLFVALLDKWVKKETLITYMGKNSMVGILFILLLGVVAAGPLYVAFPIAVLLLKKGAGIRYMVFFLGVWTSAKLPVLIYEFDSFGIRFSLLRITFSLIFFYLLGLLFEKLYDQRQLLKDDVVEEG